MNPWLINDGKAVLKHYGWPEWEWKAFVLRLSYRDGKFWISFLGDDTWASDHEATCLLNEWANRHITDRMNRWPWWKRLPVALTSLLSGLLWALGIRKLKQADPAALIAALKAGMEGEK
ncbi:MAG TPA: hypothetical protein VNA25_02835 [Phycisphaerae bacterium]|nr:hypothetical protein [Phycisphaerae bacterium]